MKHSSKILITALLLLLAGQQTPLFSQELSLPGDGKDFWVGFMFPSYNQVAAPSTLGFYAASLLISSYSDNNITVSFFDPNTGVENIGNTYFVAARTAVQVPMPLAFVKMGDSGDVPEYKACHVTAKRPINVEFFSTGACAGGSFLPITSAGLGTKYVIASYGDNAGDLGIAGGGQYGPKKLEDSHGFFEIIAPYDGTNVVITPNSTTMGNHIGYHSGTGASLHKIPYTISLSRGQCYLVKSAGNQSDDDISGSIVESNHPVAVIAGHENAALGGVTNRNLEGRDFMVEQMYPTTLWDSTGYVMIPLKDSQPADASAFDGVGEDYRTYSDSGACINLSMGSVSGLIGMNTSALDQPPPERFGVAEPVDFSSCNGKKFSVMMYDLRNFASGAPFPAPSMINIIPISHWRTSFLWYVPSNKFEILQAYYVDMIAPTADLNSVQKGIVGSFNGGPIKPIKTVLSQEQQWKGQIPNHPELTGVRFKLSPGCYYAHGPNPFMVYNFGFRALDPNFDLGDFDYDDYFFSYGLPVGMRLGSSPHIRVVIDTFCSYWNVCAIDSTLGLANQGIKQVDLMDDPDGNEYDLKPNRSVVYKNTRLDDDLDPLHHNSILFTGNDTQECFKVLVNKGTDTAYAPLFIVDDQGGAVMVELRYTPPAISLTPDSGRYLSMVLNTQLGTDSCKRYVFRNTAKKKDAKDTSLYPFKIIDVPKLKLNNPHYTITSIVPMPPTTLNMGDSLVITACFKPQDTTTQIDTIQIAAGCFTLPVDLVGNAVIPVIYATNHDFGPIIVDSTKCDTVGVYNIGKAPFTLTTNWVLQNMGVNFTFATVGSSVAPKSLGSNDLPVVILPGKKVLLQFCYTPHDETHDSTVQDWANTLQDPYKHSNKDSSILYGSGVKTGFVWDRTVQPMQVICEDSEIVRVYLLNNATPGSGSPAAHVTNVAFTGPDANEFYILANQLGYAPAQNFNIKPGASVWFDVVFKPILSKTPKYGQRRASLVASDPSEKDKTIEFTGDIFHADPVVSPSSINYGTVALSPTVTTHTFYLSNIGDTTLIVQSIDGITYPVVNITGIAPGTSIPSGQANGIHVGVDLSLNNYTDTMIILTLHFQTSCAQTMFETLYIAASFINPTNTGHNYDSVFVNCRSGIDSIIAQNLGTKDLTLKEIDIINQVPISNPPQFSFDNGTQKLLVGVVFKPNTRTNYHVNFHPTLENQWDTATVICHWDSAGVPKTSTNLLIGYGRLERDTVSPIQASYSNITNGTIDVPIKLTKTLPADVQAGGITFKVTYRRDLLNLLTASGKLEDYDKSLQDFPGVAPVITNDGAGGNESVVYTLQSKTGPITTLNPINTMHFQVMVAPDVASPVTISDAVFWGVNPQDTLCYVINDETPAAFTLNPSCGDTTLRHWLGGVKPTKIISITPNPAIEGATPAMTYQVSVDKLPVTIELFNALGEHIRTIAKDVPQSVGERSIPIGVRDIPNGLYVIRITSPNDVESGQFLIQK